MFCTRCGNPLEPSAKFCANCGAAVGAAPPPPPPFSVAPGLVRPRANRMIAGVCAAFARQYGWDLNLTRVISALLICLTGVGAIAYLIAWVVIPEEPYVLPTNPV